MKNIVLALIRLYQKSANIRKSLLTTLMPNTAADKKTCRFTPTCSQYAYAAIARYGIVKGILLGLKRIVRCHPWSQGGFDPVPN